jgi:hypothetical protein
MALILKLKKVIWIIILTLALSACGGDGEGSEESGTQNDRSETYNEVRAGARLILNYDENIDAFTGTVENITEGTLERVRVEVHLSNDVELGPTPPTDLKAGATMDISLPADGNTFET